MVNGEITTCSRIAVACIMVLSMVQSGGYRYRYSFSYYVINNPHTREHFYL